METRYDISHLVFYGIQTEKTTHRIHVDTVNKVAFTYETKQGLIAMPKPIEVITNDEWETCGYYLVNPPWLKPEHKTRATARGIRISYKDIKNCRVTVFEKEYDVFNLSPSEKGKIAVDIVKQLFEIGKIPLHLNIKEINKRTDQILGKDIDIGDVVIQVKHDTRCGKIGLFMQTHESNPYNYH